ncbi:tetraspanin-1-like isoform X2 [Dreissena polymorpha]|uniref:Tetraspanin n=1 Tax=Dreissena polymorpha TaxID=45954 RepID=A0A9D4M361_DREPO|nr:tetraspanin-1-like isoform X2 [Dreissena polymorpha]KAH3868317.1 hypothetical protein DPMN_031460 [Dreissena polymorpha]
MGCCQVLCRIFLVLVNIIFLLLGIALFALGLFVRFGSSILNGYLDTVKKSLQESASATGAGTVDLSTLDITGLLFGVALGLIFFGLFLTIIAFLGCCGGCCKFKVLLILYVIICGVLLVAQIVVIGILYGSPKTFHDPAKKALKEQIQSDFQGIAGTDIVSMAWNVVMQFAKCCGVDGYEDFNSAVKWNRTYSTYRIDTPLACCKELPSSASTVTCAVLPPSGTASDANSYLDTGCYDKLWEQTLGNSKIVIGVLVGIGVFQLCLILFGIIILVTMREKTGMV